MTQKKAAIMPRQKVWGIFAEGETIDELMQSILGV
jgi:hypothetical protein